jgi:phosphoribosylanthranilate isomerase
MSLKTLVKVGSISNLSDARYCAGMGVDFLGFRVIEGQVNAISAKLYQEIRGWVTGPQIVAELYGITDPAQLTGIMEDFRPDYVELGCEEFEKVGHALTLPFVLLVKSHEPLPPMSTTPAYVIVPAAVDNLSRFIPDHDVLLVVKNTTELDQALTHTGVSGVCLHGGVELKPGLKTYDELADILEALEAD